MPDGFPLRVFFHPHPLSACVCVCGSVCSGCNIWTNKGRSYIFSTHIHLYNFWVKFEYQGHWIKINVKSINFIIHIIQMYSTKVYLKVKVMWRSMSFNVKVISTLNDKKVHLFLMFLWSVLRGWYAFDWKVFLFNNKNAFQSKTHHPCNK